MDMETFRQLYSHIYLPSFDLPETSSPVKELSGPINEPSCSYSRRSQSPRKSTSSETSDCDSKSAYQPPETSSIRKSGFIYGKYGFGSVNFSRDAIPEGLGRDVNKCRMCPYHSPFLNLSSHSTPRESQIIDSDPSRVNGEASTWKPFESPKKDTESLSSECSDSSSNCPESLHSESSRYCSESLESSSNCPESLHSESSRYCSESLESSSNGSESLHSESSSGRSEPLHSKSSSGRSESLHSESFKSSNSDSELLSQELSESLKRKSDSKSGKSYSKSGKSDSKSVKSDSKSTESDSSSGKSSSSDSEVLDSTYTEGSFSENYTHLKCLCKGTFGCVSKGYRNSDGLLVFTKFIRKSAVFTDILVYNDKLQKKVPIEITYLQHLDHPNIVKVFDVFENDNYFHLVMEKHGCGMDLFTFINRNNCREEQLICYIFRQIVDGLSYLHSRNMVHRDVKDENCLIDENFHVKLIDFGSAGLLSAKPFRKFYGTKQYCSPEVLRGEMYDGPELEMFALGVTLYTLAFSDLPFQNKEEVLKGELKFPESASKGLVDLITGLLEPVPDHRLTLPEVEINRWANQELHMENYSFAAAVDATGEELQPSKYISLSDLDDIPEEDGLSFLQSLISIMEYDNAPSTESLLDYFSHNDRLKIILPNMV